MIRAERVNQPPSEFVEILILPNSALDRVYGSFITILAKKISRRGLVNTFGTFEESGNDGFSTKKNFFSELLWDGSTKSNRPITMPLGRFRLQIQRRIR